MNIDIKISGEPLQVQPCTDWVSSPECGGINIFVGTIKNETKGKRVIRLEFEAYESMANSEINKIAEDVLKKWSVQKTLMHYRTGVLNISEVPVVFAVSASHRDAAFEASRYTIDTFKQTVPIWKKFLKMVKSG